MRNGKLVDLTLGLSSCAWKVAKLLAKKRTKTSHQVETSTWYNGRERGLVFSIEIPSLRHVQVLCIAVFEYRNSDQICALKWIRNTYSNNPPTMESDGKLAYPTDNKHNDIAFSVRHNEYEAMARWIERQMKDYVGEIEPLQEVADLVMEAEKD